MERIKTGVYGVDDLIEGGFPKGRTILVAGATGTGKSIFGVQYLFKGATELNEPGIYVTLDERPDLIRQDMTKFGWDLQKAEDDGLLRIIDASVGRVGITSEEEYAVKPSEFDLDKIILEILSAAKDIGAKRVVIDSIPALGIRLQNGTDVRDAVLRLSYSLMRMGLTSIITTEIDPGEQKFSKYGVEEYVADGVVLLNYLSGLGAGSRTLLIRKMRATNHSDDIHRMTIGGAGIQIHPAEPSHEVLQEGI